MKLIGFSKKSKHLYRRYHDENHLRSFFHLLVTITVRQLLWGSRLCYHFMHLKTMKKHKVDVESLTEGVAGSPVIILEPKMDNTLTRIFTEGETKIKVGFPGEDEDIFPDDAKQGLCNIRAMLFLVLWYLFSFSTLFLNKYILSYLRGDPTVLGTVQLLMTTMCGLIQMYIPCGLYQVVEREGKPPRFLVNMLIVGSMRFATVILGLLALKFVAVSFTETIKSSAPIFTVVIARLILGEETSCLVNLSLIPVMGGLALCTANEVSFNVQGFLAAMATNIVDCLQNVYSKMLISGEKYRYTPAELQFYTSMAAVVVQIPVSYLLIDIPQVQQTTDRTLFIAFLLNGIFFHFQSITAYALMGYISPVTHSVANTVKRASLIWLSVVMFGNQVSVLSGLGSLVVIIGVILYNKAREHSEKNIPTTKSVSYTYIPVITSGKR